jgi:hypothetical protein
VARIIECHTGAGLTSDECTLLNLWPRDCIPRSIEERIVARQVVDEFARRFTEAHGIQIRFTDAAAELLISEALKNGVPVRDFGSTFKAYRADLVKRLDLFGDLHRFIPVLAFRSGARIAEIPIQVAPRAYGRSKYGLDRTFGVFQDIIFLEFYAKYLTKQLSDLLDAIPFNNPDIPVVSNADAVSRNSGAEIKESLVRQLNQPLLWEDSVKNIVDSGTRIFLEVGPGKVLSGLIKRIDASVTVFNIEDMTSLEKTLSALRDNP